MPSTLILRFRVEGQIFAFYGIMNLNEYPRGLPAQTRTICNISYMGFGMTEVVIEAGHFNAFTAAATAAGLEVSTTLNARLPCFRESGETAYARFMARINVRIARLEAKPPSAYFDDLIAFLKAYRDGDSNCPTFAPAARAPNQLDTVFAYNSNSLPSMGEGYWNGKP